MPEADDKLNERHLLYCQLRAEGTLAPLNCAKKVWPELTHNGASTKSIKLEKKPLIQAEIKRQCELSQTALTLSKQEKREFLARVVRTPIGEVDEDSDLAQEVRYFYDSEGNEVGKKVTMMSKQAAIEIDNKMSGDNEPEKLDLGLPEGGVMVIPGGATLDQWEKQAASSQADLKEAAEQDIGED